MSVSKQRVFFGNWSSANDMWASFQGRSTPKREGTPLEAGIKVLWASYDYMNYSGTAWVIYTDGGNLYEVHASHCSCYGLRDAWSPEETTWGFIEATYMRNLDSSLAERHSPEALAALYTLIQKKLPNRKKKEQDMNEVSKSMQKRVTAQTGGEVTIISQGEIRMIMDALDMVSEATVEISSASAINELSARLKDAKTIKVIE